MKRIRLPKLNKLFEVMEIRRVKVLVHWSVLLIGAMILLGAVEDPLLAFTVLGSCYGVILLHECGHMVASQRKRCAVWSIELYPIWGITRFDEPYSRYDHCIIAWGGVVAARLPGGCCLRSSNDHLHAPPNASRGGDLGGKALFG